MPNIPLKRCLLMIMVSALALQGCGTTAPAPSQPSIPPGAAVPQRSSIKGVLPPSPGTTGEAIASGRGTTEQAEPGSGRTSVVDPYATQFPVFDPERLSLTSTYSREHYGKDSYRLVEPRMIVVHYTAIATLGETLRFFKPDRLDRQARSDIASGGDVNVSAHYVINSKGDLYQLAPEDVICRHTIGFNQTAIGIENVAADAAHLTDAQARATAALVSRIVSRHPSIHYLIGHHEYRDSTLPHYRLLVEKDASYRFTNKTDPGPLFMAKVRQLLKEAYGIALGN